MSTARPAPPRRGVRPPSGAPLFAVVGSVDVVDAHGRRRRVEVFAPAEPSPPPATPWRGTKPLPSCCGWFADSSLDLLAGLDVAVVDGDGDVRPSRAGGRDAAPGARSVAAWRPFVAPGGPSSQSARAA